jgi:hypothetical protein
MPSPSKEEMLPAAKRFNRWQFIEAQNLWFEMSEKSEGSDKQFLSALADISGGFAKIWHKGGEPHAMVSLLTKGIQRAQKFTPRYCNMELDDFLPAVVYCLSEAKRWRRGDTDIFDRDLIPRLEFTPIPPP